MSKVATEVNPSLFWAPFEGTIEKEPLFVQYNRYQAQSATSSDTSWYIETPANGVLLDNEAWLHFTLTIDDPNFSIRNNWGAGVAIVPNMGAAHDQKSGTCFRCGNVMQRACQSIALDINGTVMTFEFSKYHDVMNRLYMTDEECEMAFPSTGGHFDSGKHLRNHDGFGEAPNFESYGSILFNAAATVDFAVNYNKYKGRSVLANNNNATGLQVCGLFPDNGLWMNGGLYHRMGFLEQVWRELSTTGNGWSDSVISYGATTATISRYAQTVNIDIYEKLSIPPFHMYDNRDIKMSIPNIRNLQLTLQFHSNYLHHIMTRVLNNNEDFTINWWDVAKPELLLRWYTPPAGYVVPKQVTLPVTKFWTYTNSNSVNVNISSGGDNRFGLGYPKLFDGQSISNISLPAVPNLFVIYYKRRLSEYKMTYPDDYNLSILSLQIDMEGNSGKLNNAQVIHFWNMYKRHLRLYPSKRDEFVRWFKEHCVIPISPADLGVIKGPGLDNPIQLSVSNIKLAYYYSQPSINVYPNTVYGAPYVTPCFNPELNANVTTAFDFHLLCLYDEYALTLTDSGSSSLQLLRVNASGTSTMPPSAAGPSSLADIAI